MFSIGQLRLLKKNMPPPALLHKNQRPDMPPEAWADFMGRAITDLWGKNHEQNLRGIDFHVSNTNRTRDAVVYGQTIVDGTEYKSLQNMVAHNVIDQREFLTIFAYIHDMLVGKGWAKNDVHLLFDTVVEQHQLMLSGWRSNSLRDLWMNLCGGGHNVSLAAWLHGQFPPSNATDNDGDTVLDFLIRYRVNPADDLLAWLNTHMDNQWWGMMEPHIKSMLQQATHPHPTIERNVCLFKEILHERARTELASAVAMHQERPHSADRPIRKM